MTEPLIVDTDQLNTASAKLGQAAGAIPAPLPKFSVSGTDSLTTMIGKSAVQVEAPMEALNKIRANATDTAWKIGLAGQMYEQTDQTQAEKAKQLQQQFGTDRDKPPQMGVDRNPQKESGAKATSPWWKPTPTDVATGAAAGIASAAHDYGLGKASKVTAPGSPLLNWTKELDVKALGKEIPGFTRAGGVLGVVTAIPGGIIDYSEAKAAGYSTTQAIGQAVAREGAGTAAGLLTGAIATGLAEGVVVTGGTALASALGAAETGALIGSVIPGAGTAVGLAAGFLVGGAFALLASKGVGSLFG